MTSIALVISSVITALFSVSTAASSGDRTCASVVFPNTRVIVAVDIGRACCLVKFTAIGLFVAAARENESNARHSGRADDGVVHLVNVGHSFF